MALFFFLFLFSAFADIAYNVSIRDGREKEVSIIEISNNSTSDLTNGYVPVQLSNDSFSLAAGSLSLNWLALPSHRDIRQNTSNIYQAGPQLAVIFLWDNLPEANYSSVENGLVCDSVLMTSHESFSCASPTFNLVLSPGVERNSLHLVITASANLNASQTAFALSLALHRLNVLLDTSNFVDMIVSKNAARMDDNKLNVAGIYVVIEVGLLFISILCAVWQTWLWVGFSCCYDEEKCCFLEKESCCCMPAILVSRPFLFWTIIFFGIQQTVCWAGGFIGWVFIAIMQVVYCLLVLLLYASFHCGCCHDCCLRCGKLCGCRDSCISVLEPEDGDTGRWRSDETTDRRQSPKVIQSFPSPLSKQQSRGLCIFFTLLLVMFIICIVIWFTWFVDDYQVYDRTQMQSVVEFQPPAISRSIAIVYSYPGLATTLRFNIVHKEQTKTCGTIYTKILSDSKKKEAIYDAFIKQYDIDMSIFARKDYLQYNSVNDWFTRGLDPDVKVNNRPIADPNNHRVLTSPADARVVVFENIDTDVRVWIKGETFKVQELLSMDASLSARFLGGSMAIVRLAPQDYHRFHAPVSGVVLSEHYTPGTIFSVNADAMRSGNGAIYNQRVVTVLDTTGFANIGQVAFVSIGAACVGSIFMSHDVGNAFTKGDEMGYFQFGGSTVVLVFEPNKILWDSDLRNASSQAVENLVRVGQRMATKI